MKLNTLRQAAFNYYLAAKNRIKALDGLVLFYGIVICVAVIASAVRSILESIFN